MLIGNVIAKIHSLSKQFCTIFILWKTYHSHQTFPTCQSCISCSFFEKHIIVQNFLLSEWALDSLVFTLFTSIVYTVRICGEELIVVVFESDVCDVKRVFQLRVSQNFRKNQRKDRTSNTTTIAITTFVRSILAPFLDIKSRISIKKCFVKLPSSMSINVSFLDLILSDLNQQTSHALK